MRKVIFYFIILFAVSNTICAVDVSIKAPKEITIQAKLQTHADTMEYVEEAAQKIIIEHLRRKGLGNFSKIDYALSYFKTYRPSEGKSTEFLVTRYHEYMQKIRAKALEDLRFYFYFSKEQIKNMVFINLAPFIQEIDKNIK